MHHAIAHARDLVERDGRKLGTGLGREAGCRFPGDEETPEDSMQRLALHAERATSAANIALGVGRHTDAQAKRGQPLYREQCASYNGTTLKGGESVPALAGGEFLSNWTGLTFGDLFERMRTSLPLNGPRKLSREVTESST
jgi:hypothetical protein